MKTIKIKKIATLSSIVLLMLFSNPVFSQGLPNAGNDNVNDEVTTPEAPINQNIWLGLIGGCLLGAFFYVGKQKNALTR